ncbi:Glycine radical domain-containing protein [Trichostrongylus colubriformis]|uniref:Glycine radical domain-containing protein n=1 Tax=Trichostrongylus colubriformis TaxID=6319 RepID=A0AAN8F1E3_TRICO
MTPFINIIKTFILRQNVVETTQSRQCASVSQSSQDEDDPYQEILRTYNDNVSHLVFHGSSLKSMTNLDFESVNQPLRTTGSCRVRFQERSDLEGRTRKTAESA